MEEEKIENIFDAAILGNMKEVQKFLDEGVDINSIDEHGDSVLSHALLSDEIKSEMIEFLLDKGANINFKNNDGTTPLILAFREDKPLKIIKLLLERGANIDEKDEDENTVLILATYENDIQLVKLLLMYKPNVNITDGNGETSLHIAVKKGYTDITKLLLEYGANINMTDETGFTALELAIINEHHHNNFEVIKILFDKDSRLFNRQIFYYLKFCYSERCKNKISQYFWKRLYNTDLKLASQFAKQTALNKDVWQLILLNKRQQQLCKNLSSDQNKEILYLFALELNIPITEEMTKAHLCGAISRQIVYGKIYHDSEGEKRKFRNSIMEMALKYNIDTNQSLEAIMKDLSKML